MSLETLPHLALDVIIEQCIAHDFKDLLALGLTNGRLAAMTRRHRLRSVHLALSNKLLEDEAYMGRIHDLALTGLGAYVRSINIHEPLPDNPEDMKYYTYNRLGPPHERTRQSDVFDDESGIEPATFWPFEDRPDTPENKAKANRLWRPLADIIGQLPRLTDLFFDIYGEVPTCLLGALHSRTGLPLVRLHVSHLNLGSLYQPRIDRSQPIHPDELMLATSPCLYSIGVTFGSVSEDGRFGFVKDAVMHMVSEAAPNLESVALRPSLPPWNAAISRAVQARSRSARSGTPIKWKGFDGKGLPKKCPFPKGSLRKISCAGNLEEFEQVADLTALESLQEVQAHAQMLSLLRRLACSSPGLPYLSWLELSLLEDCDSDDLELFLGAIPPLKSLFLASHRPMHERAPPFEVGDGALRVMVERHGPSLRQLRLPGDVDLQRSQELSASCSRLRQLDVSVRRTRGDSAEVAVYRELARLPALESVCIRLNCMSEGIPPYDPDAEIVPGGAPKPPADHDLLRRNLVNSAIDRTLARAIFGIVSNGGLNRVHRLSLLAENEGVIPDQGGRRLMETLLCWIALDWVCDKNPGDGSVSVREMDHGRLAEPQPCEELQTDFGRIDEADAAPTRRYWDRADPSTEAIGEVWRSLWPEATGDKSNSWSSLPLQSID